MITKEKERKPQPKARSGSGSAKGTAPRKKTGSAPKSRKQAAPSTVRKRPEAQPRQEKPVRRRVEQKPAEPVKTAPDVVYLPPKPFNRKRMLLHLASVVAVVIALMLGLSVFFKVDGEKITVSGNVKYSAWDISQASGIQNGDNLLTFSRARATAKILKALPYVEDVRVGIKLPDTVILYVTEVEVPYAIKAQDDSWWLISSSGKIIEADLPRFSVFSWTLQSPVSSL